MTAEHCVGCGDDDVYLTTFDGKPLCRLCVLLDIKARGWDEPHREDDEELWWAHESRVQHAKVVLGLEGIAALMWAKEHADLPVEMPAGIYGFRDTVEAAPKPVVEDKQTKEPKRYMTKKRRAELVAAGELAPDPTLLDGE